MTTTLNFEQVTAEQFAALIQTGPASDAFKQQYARFRPQAYDGYSGPDYMVHRGSLHVTGDFVAPGFFTMILGDLTADGNVDLNNPADKGFDEGGAFVALGDVKCRVFANHCGKCSFIDGDLRAEDMIVNAFEDSSLVVIKNLRTKFFFGEDIWAEVGGHAEMSYGSGYCLPIGYDDASSHSVRPEHDLEDSMSILTIEDPDEIDAITLMQRIRRGDPMFKA
jgi:hypothetical protein